jgi:hypothetical protein
MAACLGSPSGEVTVALRTICVGIVFAMLSSAAVARQPDAFDTCAKDKDSTARLACFDREVAARNAADQAAAPPVSPSAPVAATTIAAPAQTVSAAPVAATATAAPAAAAASTSDIGLDALERRRQREARGEPEPPPAAPIEALIVKVVQRQPLINAFELDNGQIWEQTEAIEIAAQPKQKVTIRHGVLGAFFLKTVDGTVVRVHRVK